MNQHRDGQNGRDPDDQRRVGRVPQEAIRSPPPADLGQAFPEDGIHGKRFSARSFHTGWPPQAGKSSP
jgi:hypothetical protein